MRNEQKDIRVDNVVDNSLFAEYCNSLRSKYIVNKNVLLIQIPQYILKSFNEREARHYEDARDEHQ